MSIREVQRSEWRAYFDGMSRKLGEQKVDIIVTASSLGAQIEATRIPLLGLTYDSHDDTLIIVSEHLEHVVSAPARILVEESDGLLASLEVVAGDGSKQILSLAPAT